MKKISFLGNLKVIEDDDNQKKVIKKRNKNTEDIYSFLENRNFENFLSPIEINEFDEVYPFKFTSKISDGDKSQDIVNLITLLHNKTTNYETLDINSVKKIYEESIENIDNLNNYYFKLQDEIEKHIFMTPAELLLMKNISKIYFLLNLSREYSEKYYNVAKDKLNIRKSLIHGNLSLEHILESDDKYLISWSKARKDIPIYDLVDLYKRDFDKIEIKSLYDFYNRKYKLYDEEKYLFFSLISQIDTITFNLDNYTNTIITKRLVDYVDMTINFILEENKEDKEAN